MKHLGLKAKLAAGFGILLLILLIQSLVSYFSQSKVAGLAAYAAEKTRRSSCFNPSTLS